MEKYKGLTMPCQQKFPVVNFRKLCAYYCKNEEKWYNVPIIKLIVAGTAAKQSAQKGSGMMTAKDILRDLVAINTIADKDNDLIMYYIEKHFAD